jgi:hypothetical protein
MLPVLPEVIILVTAVIFLARSTDYNALFQTACFAVISKFPEKLKINGHAWKSHSHIGFFYSQPSLTILGQKAVKFLQPEAQNR